MKLLAAKKLVVKGAFYYLKERRVIGLHWDEWVAASKVLTELQKKEKRLKALRGDVRRSIEFLLRSKNQRANRAAAIAILTSAFEATKR